MKVAIVGSQGYKHLQRVIDYVRSLPLDTIIVSGGAVGPDKAAEETAKQRGMPDLLIFLPDWTKYGKPAGPIRNKQIVDAADKLVAYWDGTSRGTLNSINLAKERGIPVVIIPDEEVRCCVCNLADGTVQSPLSNWYCEPHSHCPHCGTSVSQFAKRYIHGTETIEVWLCPCVIRHGQDVHNAVLLAKAKAKQDALPEIKKSKRKAS